MAFAYSETAQQIRRALGSVLRARRKEVSTERLIAVAHALGLHPADIYAELARLLGAESEQRTWPDDPPVKLRLATASLPLEALRSVADFSAYLAMANPPPKPKDRIGFLPRR